MPSPFQIEFNNQQSHLPIDTQCLRKAISVVLAGEGIARAEISVAILDDVAIHNVNREHLQHDYPTDILSFLFELSASDDGEKFLDGELIASAETAIRTAAEIGWPPMSELMLYVIHGMLHLVGYDDQMENDRAKMRELERRYLSASGVELPGNGFTRFAPLGDSLR